MNRTRFILVLILAAASVAFSQSVTILESGKAGSAPSERIVQFPGSGGPAPVRNSAPAPGGPTEPIALSGVVFNVTDPSDAPADTVPVFDPPTLRAAIQCANATGGRDVINILTIQDTIYLTSSLPPILGPVDLDGNGKVISGALLATNAFGLSLHTNNSYLHDVAIVDFTKDSPGSSIGISLQGSNDTIRGVKIHNIAGPGINLNFAASCLIGGAGIYYRNQITECTGNGGTGIGILSNSNFNTVENNFIGNDGSTAIGNSRYGVNLRGEGNRIVRNVISGNAYGGVDLNSGFGDTARNTLVEGNLIGLNDIGDVAIGTQDKGIGLMGGVNDTIRGNVICSGLIGVDATSQARGALIEKNLIGINRFDQMIGHTAGIRSGGYGFLILDNLVSGNGTGISISNYGGALIRGNKIGTDSTGTQARPNTTGISVSSTEQASEIGGPLAGHRNLISGNSGTAVQVGNTDTTTIRGNYIGTDIGGMAPLPNGEGILLRLYNGDARISGNVVSGNNGPGIRLSGRTTAHTRNTVIFGNYVGVAANGSDSLPNASDGIILDSVWHNVIGGFGPDSTNVIAFNGGDGISVRGESGSNDIYYNAIHSNGGLGIDLGDDGVNPNDAGDVDLGPNFLQNQPELLFAYSDTAVKIYAEISSYPNEPFVIDVYTSSECDPSGFGEGELEVTSMAVRTDPAGKARFWATVPLTIFKGRITATATDSFRNTSEFSNCVDLSPPGLFADLSVTVSDSADSAAVGDTLICRLVVANEGPDTVYSVVVTDSVSGNLSIVGDSLVTPMGTSDTVLTYNFTSISPGEAKVITLTTLVAETGIATHKAHAVGTGATDYRPWNNDDRDTTQAGPSTAVDTDSAGAIPSRYFLEQNYPNPFNPATTFEFHLPAGGAASLRIYSMLGELVAEPVSGTLPAGVHRATWDAAGLPSGVYYYRLVSGAFTGSGKLTLIR